MRAAVIHGSLNSAGGAEKLSLEIIRVLKCLDYHVDLITLEKTNREKIKEFYDFDIHMYLDDEIVTFPHKVLPTIYSRFIHWLLRDLITVPFVRNRYELTITTRQLLPIEFSDIIYLHFPDYLPFTLDLYSTKYRDNAFMRAYSQPYRYLAQYITKVFKSLSYKPLIVTNSNFTKSIIKKYLNMEALVIYPPVDIEKLLPLSKNSNRTDTVLTISRFEEGKCLETVVNIAKQIERKVRFVIMGSAYGSKSVKYVKDLYKKVKEVGVQDRVSLIMNASEHEKLRLLSQAKILLHPTKWEHFGIVVVEGMAAGLIPIVHRSGGPWTDIINFGKYGLAFKNIQEAASLIDGILADSNLYNEFRKLAIKRSLLFSRKAFHKKFKNLIKDSFLH